MSTVPRQLVIKLPAELVPALITVLLAVLILREPLRPLQWGAILLALIAVICIGVAYGHPLWLSLLLAISFGLYGLTKKYAGKRTGAV